jgi:UTP--glucose-1-phosphate uridylyltransferase
MPGKPTLMELSQVPKPQLESFRKRFSLFNTNNVWINLRSLHELLTNDELSTDVVTHERVVDRVKILQLETIIGAAIRDFRKVLAIKVPRMRYLPVKSTSDLFLIQSNLYSVSRGSLVLNPAR